MTQQMARCDSFQVALERQLCAELEPSLVDELTEHLRRCSECRAYSDEMIQIAEHLRANAPTVASRDIQTVRRAARRYWRSRKLTVMGTSAGVLALGALFVWGITVGLPVGALLLTGLWGLSLTIIAIALHRRTGAPVNTEKLDEELMVGVRGDISNEVLLAWGLVLLSGSLLLWPISKLIIYGRIDGLAGPLTVGALAVVVLAWQIRSIRNLRKELDACR